ncbi:O-antigen ligase family protein [Streptomyces antarcticus]|uniref:O-antigen ligase family protein n=1 Tax=Streptomyces antarcticus TaxID=2996458 RepID=UPI00227052E2|nr:MULTISPECIES: O-antigen ligase family protein [unclassified Streptomyces]MCY0946672.1 O-antigen ligase family protein [Streptomyces sp. H34-AA3]MCZ4081304.1 O-antigen ligase family protein [Streptomyces sp. H34-S5]
MTIGEIGAVLRRRWYVMVPLTVLSLLAGLHLYRSVPVAYQSQSSVALLDSTAVAELAPAFGNPISNAGGSLVVTADVLIRTLSGTDAARALQGLGVTDPYTVGFAANTSGPMLTLTVTGFDRAKVLEETSTLTAFAGEQLNALQAAAEVQPAYFVQTAPVVLPQTPVPQLKSRYQQVLGVVILGTTAGFVLSFVTESLLAARRRGRGTAPDASGTVPAASGTAQASAPARRPRRRPRGRPLDATALLTGYLALAFFIPSNLTLPGMGGVGTPANVFALLCLFWYLATWITGRIRPAPGTRLPRVVMCLLAVAVLASYLANASRGSSHKEVLAADRGLIGLLVWVSLVVLVSAGIQSRERLDVLLRRAVVMGAVVAAIGYYDFFTATNIADRISIPGLQSSVAQITTLDRGSFTRPRSTTAQPLEFGGMLALLLPFAVQQAFDPVRRHLSGRRRWAPVVLMGGALPLTVSRTSIIGVLIVVLVMVVRWKPERRWAAIGLLLGSVACFKVIVPGLIGTITTLFGSFLSNSDSSTQARTVKYGAIVPYLGERPLFGQGFGTFLPELYFFTDNQYMLTLAEMGFLGLVALLALFLTGIHQGGAIRRLARGESDRELGQAFFASALVSLVSAATFDALSFPMFAGMFFLTIAAGGSYLGFIRRAAPKPRTVESPCPPVSPAPLVPGPRTPGPQAPSRVAAAP